MNAKRCVYLPYLGCNVRLGRTPGDKSAKKLHLANYLRGSLPTPPATFDYSGPASKSIAQTYLNDQLGDCVIACGAHLEGVWTANASTELIYSQSQIVSQYSAIGGYVPGNPNTDQGCNEQTALEYWVKNGFAGGTKLAGYLSVNPKNPSEYYTALYLFENLIYGIPLPDSWLQNPQPGFVWDADTPDNQNGHCVLGVGRVPNGVKIATWGMTGTVTDAAHAADVDELWVALSTDQVSKAQQMAPNGFNWLQLVTDFDVMGGNVPTPNPIPVPPGPNPLPPVPPVPPLPPQPNPISQFQQIIDSTFAKWEGRFRRNKNIVAVLKMVNEAIDEAIQTTYGSSPVFVGISPTTATVLINGAFISVEALLKGHPFMVGALKVINPMVVAEIVSLLQSKSIHHYALPYKSGNYNCMSDCYGYTV